MRARTDSVTLKLLMSTLSLASRFRLFGLVIVLLGSACGDDGGTKADGGPSADLGGADAGPADAFASDAFVEPPTHLASTANYSPTGELSIDRPSESAEGDLLVLFLSRTDDLLPLRLEGWSAVTSCLKSNNTQLTCLSEADCTEMDGDYCLTFGDSGTGRDLASAVFTRVVGPTEAASYGWSLRGVAPSWAILSAVRGVDPADPIRDSAATSHDADPNSLFPSAAAEVGDLLLLSQAFDDTAAEDAFLPPAGMALLRWIAGADEAGYVFGASLTESGPTGERETRGVGGPNAKDLMITVVVAGR